MTPSKAPIRMLDYSRCMAAVATDSVDIVDWGIGVLSVQCSPLPLAAQKL